MLNLLAIHEHDSDDPDRDVLRANLFELAHTAGEVGFWRLDQDVVVVLNKTVSAPLETSADLTEQREPVLPVGIVEIDRLAVIAAYGDVIQTASEFKS